ncbi:MAG: helix-turn-helix domain-containing protein [Bacteriovoracaceae bacterium]|nr:helix-turn-helix domain-containing protein [Bacteriovoracaceae bacterium]
MAEFKRNKLELFLGATRKYMQVRGAMSQKDLAEQTDVGISTMSRFLSQKSTELNPQLIAKITAKLNIPLHEMIDFVEEDFADRFIRLVKFYKDELKEEDLDAGELVDSAPDRATVKIEEELSANRREEDKARINDKTNAKSNSDKSIREKLESLTPRQRAFMTEFLNLKLEERDLIVDLGNNMFQYFKMKGMDL